MAFHLQGRFRRALLGVFAAAIVPYKVCGGEEPIQEPLDPVAQAQRALSGFMTQTPLRLPGNEGYYRAMFDSALLPVPMIGHATDDGWCMQWDLGDCTGRAVPAWIALREMTGDRMTGGEVECGQRAFLLSMLHPETGLIWYSADTKNGIYRYHIWDQSRTLLALVYWFRACPEDRVRLKPLIERMIRGLEAIATVRGTDPVWGSYAGMPSDTYVNEKPGSAFGGHFVNNRAGICIEPLVGYADLTGNANALELAILFANCELGGHEGDAVPPGKKPYFCFGDNGSFVGHFHTKAGTLIGLANLARRLAAQGRVREAKSYLLAARKSYDWIFSKDNPGRGSRIGWFPESPGGNEHETCCATDMIELAGALASCASLAPEFSDWVNLYDDEEAIAVNLIARAQLRFTPDFEKELASYYGENASKYMPIARHFDGTWLGILPPNDRLKAYSETPKRFTKQGGIGNAFICLGGCCQYAGVSGLYAGWREAMAFEKNRLSVRYFMNRQSDFAEMKTQMPREGRVDIALRQTMNDVRIRVPQWLDASQVSLLVNNKPIDATKSLDADKRWLNLGSLVVGTDIRLCFPLDERQTEEVIARKKFVIDWRGNYVVKLRPTTAKWPIFP